MNEEGVDDVTKPTQGPLAHDIASWYPDFLRGLLKEARTDWSTSWVPWMDYNLLDIDLACAYLDYPSPAFHYSPLDTRNDEMRLLLLLPECHTASTPQVCVSGSIIHVRRETSPPYFALSYTWGDATKTRPILINNKTFHIRENLAVALEQIRHKEHVRALWVDAICIDQEDDHEKTIQIQKKGETFKQAFLIIAWLGPSRDDSDSAMHDLYLLGGHLLKAIQDCGIVDFDTDADFRLRDLYNGLPQAFVDRHGEAVIGIESIVSLFDRPFWQRIWILQEASLPNVLYLCGESGIPGTFMQFAYILLLYMVNPSRTRDWKVGPTTERTLKRMSMDPAVALLYASASPACSLKELLSKVNITSSRCNSFQAIDPKDHIFALLGICSDADELGISLDYTKTCQQVYMDCARAYLEKKGDLDILGYCQFPKTQVGLPSWVPDWSMPMRPTIPFLVQDVPFLSGGDKTPLPSSFSIHDTHDGAQVLSLPGLRVGTITTIGQNWSSLPEGTVTVFDLLADLDQLSGYTTNDAALENMTDPVWRVPIADSQCGFNGGKDRLQIRAGMWNYNSYRTVRHLQKNLLSEEDPMFLPVKEGAVYYSYRALLVTVKGNRRFFTSSEGFLGLGPDCIQPSDIICICKGAAVPFVLRKVSNSPRFQFIGEAYIEGVMNGELFRQDPRLEEFVLI